MFHSDRGVQYTSKAFCTLLAVNKVVQSFSKSGSPHDNAVAEAFFASLKKEELYRTNYQSEHEFRKSIENYILFYNIERPHRTLVVRFRNSNAIIAVNFFVYQGERPQEYIRISRDFNADRRKKAA